MGTRGLVGFYIKGKYKLSYNHHDSYIMGLGVEVAKAIHFISTQNRLKELEAKVEAIKMVNNEIPPSKALQDEYRKFSDLGVGKRDVSDWYCLLRKVQGADILEAVLNKNLCHMLDGSGFAQESLFCEWGYIVNFDSGMLEIFNGFQKTPDLKGPFGVKQKNGYYPIKLIAAFRLNSVTAQDLEALNEALSEE